MTTMRRSTKRETTLLVVLTIAAVYLAGCSNTVGPMVPARSVEMPAESKPQPMLMKVWHGVSWYSEIECYLGDDGEPVWHGKATSFSGDATKPCFRLWFKHGQPLDRRGSWKMCSGRNEDYSEETKLLPADIQSMTEKLSGVFVGRPDLERRVEIVPRDQTTARFSWETAVKPYKVVRLEKKNSCRIGAEHRSASVVFTDPPTRVGIETAGREIYDELKQDIERACPGGDAKRINLRIYLPADNVGSDIPAFHAMSKTEPLGFD